MAISDKLKELQTEGQPKTMDELFMASKEKMLLERINQFLKDTVFKLRKQIKNDIQDIVSEITKNELSSISAENLKKEAKIIVKGAQDNLEKILSSIIDQSESTFAETSKMKDIAFLVKDTALRTFKKETSNITEEITSLFKKATSEKINFATDFVKIKEEISSELDNFKKEIPNMVRSQLPRGGKGGGGSTMRVDNLSSQANGTTRTFTATHRIGEAHLVFYSSFPTFFLPTTDYTISGTSITLSSSIDPPVAGQSLAIFYESAD